MTFPEVQFVAAPEDGAEVLFDFNDNFGLAPAQIIAGSFSLGTPSVEGDPDGLGVKYGPREVSFSLLVFGSRYAALETQATLARTFMLRRRGWLRVKLDEFTSPVWLRTYTPTPSELDFSLIQPDFVEDAWQIEVTVAAEPFVRGERIELWSGRINNDPVHATNPLGVTLPGVVGDAAAPCRISATFSQDRDHSNVLLSSAAVPEDHTPTVWQIGTGDGWGVSSDTSAPVVDANMSGGSYRSCSFSVSTGMLTRIAGVSSGATPPPGRYRVMLRAARTGEGVFAFQFGYRMPYGDTFAGSPRVLLERNNFTWMSLGEFDFPLPRTGVDMPAGSAAASVALAIERVSGSASVLLDAFLLVPVDVASVTNLEGWEKSDTLVTEFGAVGPSVGEPQLWDGDAEVSLRLAPGGVLDGKISAPSRGRYLSLRPGNANRLTVIQQAKMGPAVFDPVETIFSYVDVSVSYQPRWLWLGGG